MHGDVRVLDDLLAAGEARRAGRVLGGALGAGRRSTAAPITSSRRTSLGAYNCLELARRARRPGRVPLDQPRLSGRGARARSRYEETDTRFELARRAAACRAHRAAGIAEDFPLDGARTLYGATKLAAELLIEEYRAAYGLRAVIDRCGVIAGPWQMGKVDQGVFTYWMLAHHFGRPLRYIGFGGSGKQVRDLLHVDDLLELLDEQLADPARWDGVTVNVGGGASVQPLAARDDRAVREITGNEVDDRPSTETRPGDVPIYISDCAAPVRADRLAPAAHGRRDDPAPTSTPGSSSTKRPALALSALGSG